ncbi:amino acid adenylation domain-containing protein [Lachnospiraceae bacterium C1.1]|nr:amino acid adenylation domain-containing protein [Lachnospiraceae bacterium C1.1]
MNKSNSDNVVKMFEEQVETVPQKTAVTGNTASLTYQELNEYANRLANALICHGIERDDIVMIFLPRNFIYYAVNIGVLKSGAAFTTVNTAYPDERIKFICEDSGCRYIISSTKIYRERRELFDSLGVRPLFLENLLTSQWPNNPDREIASNDLAYCIYTSGSTGRPKGVMIEHGNLYNFLEHDPENREVMEIIDHGNTVIACAALTFDFSLMEEFIPLTSGMTVVMASDEQIMNPLLFNEQMLKNNVDTLMCTPSFLDMLLSVPALREALGKLKALDMGAEAFPPDLYNNIRKVNQDVIIINGYGPTETTISCISKIITSAENITIGKPASNVSCYIVDDELNEVEKGELGELLICGRGVGRGYIKLEEQTKKAFVSFRGMRAYRSGDLARLDDNGEIDFRGRMDSQVKLRGLRIELQEIESIMSNCPLIGKCAATAVDNRYLCFYYTLNDPALSEDEARGRIREFAKDKLAHYMIPDIYVRLEEMPLTANWKIDRKKLPRPEIKTEEGKPAETDMQKMILKLISDIIKRPIGGIDTDLLELGITSLDFMKITAALGEKYKIPLRISDISSSGNIEDLERKIIGKQNAEDTDDIRRTPAMITQGMYYRLWHMYNSTENVMPVMIRLNRSLPAEKLTDAVRRASLIHPGLFLKFDDDDEKLMVSIPETSEMEKLARNIPVKVIRIQETELSSLLSDVGKELIYPDKDYYDFRIIETEQYKYLVMRFSHVLGDGDSVSIFIDDILRILDGRTIVEESVNIVQYAAENNLMMESLRTSGVETYYDKLLGKLHEFPSIPDAEDTEEIGFNDTALNLRISGQELEKITDILSISENIFFAGITALILGHFFNCSTFPLLIVYNGRDDYRVKNTFGILVSPVLVAVDADKSLSLKEYMRNISRQFFEGVSEPLEPEKMHELYPGWTDFLFIYQSADNSEHTLYGETVREEWLSNMTEGEEDEIFENMVDNEEETEPDILTITAERWASDQSKFQIFEDEDGYACNITLPLGKFDKAVPTAMLEDMIRICAKIRENPDNIHIGDLFDE